MPCGMRSVRQLTVSFAVDIVKKHLVLFIFHRQVQIENWTKDFNNPVLIPANTQLLPAALSITFQPNPGAIGPSESIGQWSEATLRPRIHCDQ